MLSIQNSGLINCCLNTVEALYSSHSWDHRNVAAAENGRYRGCAN